MEENNYVQIVIKYIYCLINFLLTQITLEFLKIHKIFPSQVLSF
jgi:hypothetical protein